MNSSSKVTPKKLKAQYFCLHQRTPGWTPPGLLQRQELEALVALFKEELAKAGLAGQIRAQRAGCLDTCEFGPSVVIYPDNVWYGPVHPQDIAEIVRSHLVEGNPVERLRIPGE